MFTVARTGRPRAFTMIELMMIVVIVAVLAAVAIPIYGRYVRNSRVSEATTRIGEIITAAKVYATAHPNADGEPTWPPATGGGIVSLESTDLFDYRITTGASGDATTMPLTVAATGIVGRKMAGTVVTVTLPNINSGGTTSVQFGD